MDKDLWIDDNQFSHGILPVFELWWKICWLNSPLFDMTGIWGPSISYAINSLAPVWWLPIHKDLWCDMVSICHRKLRWYIDMFLINHKFQIYPKVQVWEIRTKRTSCAHKWGQHTPTLITTRLIQKYSTKIPILYHGVKKLWKPHFGANIRQHRVAVDGMKMNSGHETQPKRLNARYEMNCTVVFDFFSFQKKMRTPFSSKYLVTRGQTWQ